MAIQVYQGAMLILERAEHIAPHAFLDAYAWFYKHAGEMGPRPYGSSAPKDINIKLAAQRGSLNRSMRNTPSRSLLLSTPFTHKIASMNLMTALGLCHIANRESMFYVDLLLSNPNRTLPYPSSTEYSGL